MPSIPRSIAAVAIVAVVAASGCTSAVPAKSAPPTTAPPAAPHCVGPPTPIPPARCTSPSARETRGWSLGGRARGTCRSSWPAPGNRSIACRRASRTSAGQRWSPRRPATGRRWSRSWRSDRSRRAGRRRSMAPGACRPSAPTSSRSGCRWTVRRSSWWTPSPEGAAGRVASRSSPGPSTGGAEDHRAARLVRVRRAFARRIGPLRGRAPGRTARRSLPGPRGRPLDRDPSRRRHRGQAGHRRGHGGLAHRPAPSPGRVRLHALSRRGAPVHPCPEQRRWLGALHRPAGERRGRDGRGTRLGSDPVRRAAAPCSPSMPRSAWRSSWTRPI